MFVNFWDALIIMPPDELILAYFIYVVSAAALSCVSKCMQPSPLLATVSYTFSLGKCGLNPVADRKAKIDFLCMSICFFL